MATDYEVILLDGAAFGHCAGEPRRGDAGCDHRARADRRRGEHQGAILTAPNSPLAPPFLKRGEPSQTVGGFASERVQHG
jgi:hypothetical protein